MQVAWPGIGRMQGGCLLVQGGSSEPKSSPRLIARGCPSPRQSPPLFSSQHTHKLKLAQVKNSHLTTSLRHLIKLDMLKKTNNGPAMQSFEQSVASPLEIIYMFLYNQCFSYKESFTLQSRLFMYTGISYLQPLNSMTFVSFLVDCDPP